MTRLAAYLVRIFSADALALFAIVSFLLFLAQMLRTFDVVTVKGQDLLTLASQTLLSMPSLIQAFAHLCVGIGLARGLSALQQSQELHIIHTSRRTRALFGAIATYTGVATVLVLVFTNFVEPLTKRQYNALQSDINADLVRRTLVPDRFIELTPGVTLVIGARGSDGEIGSFFADDKRGEQGTRRTYIANAATLALDDRGYVIKLRDGHIQNLTAEGRYSEIAFASYDLAIDRLSRAADAPAGIDEVTSPVLVAGILAGEPHPRAWRTLVARLGDGVNVLALCAMVAAIASFPRGERRRNWLPLELLVLLVAFIERAVSGYAPLRHPMVPNSGALVLCVIAAAILLWRLRPRRSEPLAAPA